MKHVLQPNSASVFLSPSGHRPGLTLGPGKPHREPRGLSQAMRCPIVRLASSLDRRFPWRLREQLTFTRTSPTALPLLPWLGSPSPPAHHNCALIIRSCWFGLMTEAHEAAPSVLSDGLRQTAHSLHLAQSKLSQRIVPRYGLFQPDTHRRPHV